MTKNSAALRILKPITLLAFGLLLFAAMVRLEAAPPESSAAAQAAASRVAVDADDIGGVVTDSKGPEAGVWVIAETTDLPTKFRKIVVTDDAGRYLLPQLPKATYKVWVRGYGLVDSKPVEATPGNTVALTAVIAPSAAAAAQYYPADYWYSLLNIPPKSAFPLKGSDLKNQAEYVYYVKRGCSVCHQMGTKMMREIEPNLGNFDSPSLAWDRRIMSGQDGFRMKITMDHFGHDRGLAMFADWSNRIAAGELPPAPARPQGVERNVVVTLWEVDTEKSFIHDVVSTNELNPTENAYGKVYASDFLSGELWALDLKDQLQDRNPRSGAQRSRPQIHGAVDAAEGDGSFPSLGQRTHLERYELYRHAAHGQQGPHLASRADPPGHGRLLQERLRQSLCREFPDAAGLLSPRHR